MVFTRSRAELVLFRRVLENYYSLPLEEVPLQQTLLRMFSKEGKELKKELLNESDKQIIRDLLGEFFEHTSWHDTRYIRGRLRLVVIMCDEITNI